MTTEEDVKKCTCCDCENCSCETCNCCKCSQIEQIWHPKIFAAVKIVNAVTIANAKVVAVRIAGHVTAHKNGVCTVQGDKRPNGSQNRSLETII